MSDAVLSPLSASFIDTISRLFGICWIFRQHLNGLIAKMLYKLSGFAKILRVSDLLPDTAMEVMDFLIVESMLGKVNNDIPKSLI